MTTTGEPTTEPTTAAEPELIPDLDQATKDWLDGLKADVEERAGKYATPRRYYDGEHGVRLTKRAKKYLQANGCEQYAHNFCERVVDSMVDRLEISGVVVEVSLPHAEQPALGARLRDAMRRMVGRPPATPTAATPAEGATVVDDDAHAEREAAAGQVLTEWLADHLEQIGFDELANIVHHEAVCTGDGYAIPFFDADRGPAMTFNVPDCMAPVYRTDDPLTLDYVAKVWATTYAGEPLTRLNVYRNDTVEKYADGGSGWVRWIDAEDAGAWPLPWVNADGTARGVGAGHFRNKNRGRRYGTSELRTAMPQQNAINKRMVDLDHVCDNMGFAQRWATGVADVKSMRNFAGALWHTSSKDAKFGEFPPGDTSQVLAAAETGVRFLAGTTATPLHTMIDMGDPPSGESLKTAEAPLVGKVEDRQLTFGRVWNRLLRLLLQMALDHGLVRVEGLEGARITVKVQWAKPEARNEKDHWEVQSLKVQAGVSTHTILAEDGYDAEREETLKRGERERQSAALARGLRAGNEDGDAPE